MTILESKNILVIGAGLLGGASAIKLAEAGASVMLADIDTEKADEIVTEIRDAGGNAKSVSVDICDPDSLAAAVAEAVAFGGGLNGLYINSYDGKVARQDNNIVDIDLDIWRRSWEGNVSGTLIAMREAILHIVSAGGGAVL